MKKLLILLVVLSFMNCSKKDELCSDLFDKYIIALDNAGGSVAGANEITRQYNERKKELGCY